MWGIEPARRFSDAAAQLPPSGRLAPAADSSAIPIEIIRMMMESRSALIERRQGWPTPASRCLKIQHQSFKCLKERIVQKGPEGRRLLPLASGSRPDRYRIRRYFEPTRRLRDRA
jgi:hypothetical protein